MVDFFLSIVLACVAAVLGAIWFILRQSCPANSSSQNCDTSAEETSENSVKQCPVSGASEERKDPIHEFADGEKKNAPFMCPFMAAFKSAQEKQKREAEDEEDEEQDEQEDDALKQFKEIMDGYQSYKEKKEEKQREERQEQKDDDDLETSCNTMVAHIKRLEQEKMILQLTEEEMEAEKKARQSQLAEIYALMQAQQDKFGISNVNDMQKQMRLYVT